MEATANFHGGDVNLASMKANPTSMEEVNTASMGIKRTSVEASIYLHGVYLYLLPWKLPQK